MAETSFLYRSLPLNKGNRTPCFLISFGVRLNMPGAHMLALHNGLVSMGCVYACEVRL